MSEPLDITGHGASASDVPHGRRLAILTIGALGVVYGDIGTSPLYAIKECFDLTHGVEVNHANVLGILSLIFWSLAIVISVKYVMVVMRADNRGEGGVLALTALALRRQDPAKARARAAIVAMGLFGAALLYGDGMITPAISVLSAVEGLSVRAPTLAPMILPITVGILVAIFAVQHRGTARIGSVFGPIVLVWFACLSVLGIAGIARAPQVLSALAPWHAVEFFVDNGTVGFVTLSAVFLAVTGGEALYADMGHFGRRPIRLGWYFVALPALVLNYFGQGALLLVEPDAVTNPFYRLAPHWALYPLVTLATMAAIIASQAVITGAFSLTRQAVQLGYLPRLPIRHTSKEAIGQIYVPQVNWMLMLATIWLVLHFGSSSALAGAYGVAVSTTMVLTTILIAFVARRQWGWRKRAAYVLMGAFLVLDLAYFSANLTKIHEGGWFPLLVGAVAYLLMATWRSGRRLLEQRLDDRAFPLERFVEDVAAHPPVRVPGISVFMTGTVAGTPVSLLHNVKCNKVLHQSVVLLSLGTEEIPHVPAPERVKVESLGQGFYRVTARYGFMDGPDVFEVLDACRAQGHDWPLSKTFFYLGRMTLILTDRSGMASWRKKIFVFMSRNAERATAYFGLPAGRVVELGLQVEL